MDKLKKSIEPFAMYYFIYLATLLPSFIASFITKFVASKMSLVFSNVPGPKKPLTFVEKKAKSMFFFVPSLGNLGSGISILSHGDIVKIGCISDIVNIPEP